MSVVRCLLRRMSVPKTFQHLAVLTATCSTKHRVVSYMEKHLPICFSPVVLFFPLFLVCLGVRALFKIVVLLVLNWMTKPLSSFSQGTLTYLKDIVIRTLFLVICITHQMSHFLKMFPFMQIPPICRAMLMRWFLQYLTCFRVLFLYLIRCRYPLFQLLGHSPCVHLSPICFPASIFSEF